MYPFKEGSFAVRNGWYVAAFAHEVGRELLGRTILNLPIVLYRKEDGIAVAVGGRCPHRHFPLAAGCLTGDRIICGYHGIAFNAEGRCVDIPSQDSAPRSYTIPTYPLVEHGIWLWIWPGDPAKADPALLPALEEIGAVGGGMETRPLYVNEVAGRYQLLNDNLLDLTHLAYLHGNSIGSPENASAPETLVKRPGFLGSRRTIHNAPVPPTSAAIFGVGAEEGSIDRTAFLDFYLPGFHAGGGEMRYPRDHPERAGEFLMRTRVFHAVTPATHRTCTYFLAVASRNPEHLGALAEGLKPVIAEDIFATEEIEKMLAIVGEEPRELLIKSDRNAVEGRRMLQTMMDAENIPAELMAS